MKPVLGLVVALAACSSANPTGLEPVSCPTGSTLTYANFGESFVHDNCLSCHDHQTPTFTSQAAIQANADAILQEAVYTDAMPDGGSMALDERELLGEWIACGAP